jgi:hypothetical protein
MKPFIRLGPVIAALLTLIGCGQSDASRKYASIAARHEHLDWSLKSLVDAYQVAGHTDPKWDDSAKTALTEFARLVSNSTLPDEEAASIISNNCATAVGQGCDDPMIQYLYIRYCMEQAETKEKFAEAFCNVAQQLENSSYPAIRKYYGWLRTGQQVIYAYGYGTNVPPEIQSLGIWGHAESDLMAALDDQTMPAEEVYDASNPFLDLYQSDKVRYATLYKSITDKVAGKRTKSAPILLLKGGVEISLAWQARGNGYADTVTTDAAKLFNDHLDAAETALTKAWALDPGDTRIADKMLTVELGQGKGRNHMELWFKRAMDSNSNNYEACSAKLTYLEPKWYGSVNDMLDFGRQCVANEKWGGRVPLILVDAHLSVQRQYATGWVKTNYWSQPEVWADINSAYTRFFELNPDATSWYHNYAWYAYQAAQWDTFNDLVPKLGQTNYEYFDGKDNFDKMVEYSKKRAARPTSEHSSPK